MATSFTGIILLDHLNEKYALTYVAKYFRKYMDCFIHDMKYLSRMNTIETYTKYHFCVGHVLVKFQTIQDDGSYCIKLGKMGDVKMADEIGTDMIITLMRTILSEYGTYPSVSISTHSYFDLHGKLRGIEVQPNTGARSIPGTLQSE